jgi:SAM-dependent methyltransferase
VPWRLSERERSTRWIQRTRRHPRRTQFDYLHLKYLLEGIADALGGVAPPVRDVLDIFCGARPYDDLLPAGAHCVGLDVMDTYGLADVVTDEFLPFPDESFDLVMCLSAFYFVADPVEGLSEIRRVLRPGGTVLITVPLVWEYHPDILEHRYTGPELADLLQGWSSVSVVENGGRAVAWGFLTGHMLDLLERKLQQRSRAAILLHPAFVACYLLVNAAAGLADRLERRREPGSPTLPMNLLVTARRPSVESTQ